MGCEIILPRLNVSPAGATDLSPETEALLQEVAAEDFALYQTLVTPGRAEPMRSVQLPLNRFRQVVQRKGFGQENRIRNSGLIG